MPQSLSQLDKTFKLRRTPDRICVQPVPSPFSGGRNPVARLTPSAACPWKAGTVFQELQRLAFTSGAKVRSVRFPIIALRATLYNGDDMPHMPRTGSSGLICMC
ncbi:MAG: hypothetical protein ACLRVT_04850 [Oscillospiraceae bacterium]